MAHEEGERNDFRAVLGNDTAIKAYWGNKLPFPDGTIVMPIAWSYGPSEENNRIFVRAQSLVPGLPTGSYPQFMVKNSKRYAANLPLRRRSRPDRNNF